MAYIYCVTNTANNKKYVGKCTQTIGKRWGEHLRDSKKERCEKRPLYDALNKYGEGSFNINELEICSEIEAAEREVYWISKLGTYGRTGYNATKGGDGSVLYDYDLIVETYQTGLNCTETAAKIGCSVDTVMNVLKIRGINGNSNYIKQSCKEIQQFTKDGKFLRDFKSITEAAETVGVHRTAIGRAVNGKAKSSAGFIWKYKEI